MNHGGVCFVEQPLASPGLLMNIEMALKSRSYILDLERVRLSFGIFFFLICLMERFFYQLSGSTFIFVKTTH